MYFPKVYVLKVYSLKVYFSTGYFSKVFFCKVFLSKVYFCNEPYLHVFYCFKSLFSVLSVKNVQFKRQVRDSDI